MNVMSLRTTETELRKRKRLRVLFMKVGKGNKTELDIHINERGLLIRKPNNPLRPRSKLQAKGQLARTPSHLNCLLT